MQLLAAQVAEDGVRDTPVQPNTRPWRQQAIRSRGGEGHAAFEVGGQEVHAAQPLQVWQWTDMENISRLPVAQVHFQRPRVYRRGGPEDVLQGAGNSQASPLLGFPSIV
jgi:hypothetical protein